MPVNRSGMKARRSSSNGEQLPPVGVMITSQQIPLVPVAFVVLRMRGIDALIAHSMLQRQPRPFLGHPVTI
jgi:hypothetical protein